MHGLCKWQETHFCRTSIKPSLESAACTFRNTFQIQLLLLTSTATSPDQACISPGIDHYNSGPLTGLPSDILALLQSIPDTSGRMILLKSKSDHIVSFLKILQWLSIVHRIKSKVLPLGSTVVVYSLYLLLRQHLPPLFPLITPL